MNEREFQIAGKNYKLNKADAFKQFHIVRRMGPLMGELMPAMKSMHKVLEKTELNEAEKFELVAEIAGPLFIGFSKLSDKDSEFILNNLLACVEVQEERGNWARLATESGPMFQNLELPIILQAAGRALMFNIGNFFAVAPSVLPGRNLKPKGK